MNDLIRQIRALPQASSPGDLSRRVMDALPGRRGLPGRLEYALRQAMPASYGNVKRRILLPSDPAELGLCFMSTGVFFLCLGLVVIFSLGFAGVAQKPGGPILYLLPVPAAAVFLVLAGWRQIVMPGGVLPQHADVAAAGGLFAITAVTGFLPGTATGLNLIAAWLGISGLAVSGGLVLTRKLSFKDREVHRENTCSP